MDVKIVFLVAILLVLTACTSQNFDPSKYTMPSDYELQSYEVAMQDGYAMHTEEIIHSKEANLTEIWLEWKEKKEGQDKYDMIKKVYHDDTELEEEEEELEYYCESLFSNSCLEMEYIHDHNGCREVEVECDKYNSDDICIRYDIDIKPERLDDDVCEE